MLFPNDEGFMEAAAAWCLIVQHQPDVIVIPNNASDVQAAIRFAKEKGLNVTVQATGHGQPKTCAGGMLLVTSQMKGVSIEGNRARIQGGAKWGDVMGPAYAAGLAPVSGSSTDVGVVGYLLGGGIGITVRTFGLGIDSIRSFEIVTPDGQLKSASESENSELFWALKGGGGAFGVITEIEIELVDCAHLYGGSMMFPYDRAEEILTAYANWTPTLPCEATVCATIMNFPPVPFIPEHLQGKAFVTILGALCTDEATAAAILKPIADLGPVMNDFGMIPYVAADMIHKDPVDPLPASGRGGLLKRFTPETARQLVSSLGDISISPNLMIQIRHIGSRNSALCPPTSSMDALRDAEFLLYMLGVPMGPVTIEMIQGQAEQVLADIAGDIYCRGPLNWIGEADIPADRIRECYGACDLDRIKAVKAEVDPNNMFANAGVGIQ